MEIGKVPENILKRSVFKQICHRREEVILSPSVGEDCTALKLGEEEFFVMSVDPITAAQKGMGTLAVHVTVNDLASSGAEPVGVMLCILLPPGKREKALRELMQEMESVCRDIHIEILGGHTEVTDVVKQPLITVTGVGKVKEGNLISTGGLKPGDELVMTKWAGMEGAAILAVDQREKLLETLPEDFLNTAAGFSKQISVLPEARIALKNGVHAMHDVTEGGIFGALWEMGEASGTGITVDLKKIPIKQEIIEISEVFDINPYQMMSSGSMLLGCENGNRMVEALLAEGIPAAVIGKATDSRDRIILNGDEVRYLEPAGSDEIYKK